MGTAQYYSNGLIGDRGIRKKYAQARKALARFVAITTAAEWKHLMGLKQSFPAADYVSGIVIFDIGGNKYRLVAAVDFDEQIVAVQQVLTHEQYNRE